METSQPTAPPALIGALLRIPAEAVHRRILDDAAAAGFGDLVPAHLAVLRFPGPDGRRPSDLAEAAGVSRQAMSYLLGELERIRYVVRESDPDDTRSKRVRLTARGSALSSTIRRSVATIEGELAEDLGPRRYLQLRQLLVALNETPLVRGHEPGDSGRKRARAATEQSV